MVRVIATYHKWAGPKSDRAQTGDGTGRAEKSRLFLSSTVYYVSFSYELRSPYKIHLCTSWHYSPARTLNSNFQHYQGPNQFSRSVKGPKLVLKISGLSRAFQGARESSPNLAKAQEDCKRLMRITILKQPHKARNASIFTLIETS
jgi:hypothetical protein